MTTENKSLTSLSRTITRTVDRMKTLDHLPQDLVRLLGRIAAWQVEAGDGLCLDLSGLDLSGSPLCRPGQFPRDRAHFLSMAENVLGLILDQPEPLPPAMLGAAEKFKTGLDAGTLDLEGALKEILDHPHDQPQDHSQAESTPILAAWADQTHGAPAALAFLVLVAAAPGLEACGAAIAQAGRLDAEQIGSHGACPVCGSLPYILELRGKEGARYAHCSLCRHDYRISRLACPACSTQDPEKLKYFTTDGETGFRVETCDNCKAYVKTIDFRALDQNVFAPLNDLESLALDLLSQDQGYHRLAQSVWGI